MNRRLDELWLDALETKVDGQVVVYLKKNHPDYQDALERQEKLTKQYPILIPLLNGSEKITLSEEEHRALREYLANQDELAGLEKEYCYYFGQSNVFSYGRMLKKLYSEMHPEGNQPIKKKLVDMILEERTCDAELEYLKNDKEYQKRRTEAAKQQEIFKEMSPPEEIEEQVDKITSSINDYWMRYSDMIYYSALSDILTFLIEG